MEWIFGLCGVGGFSGLALLMVKLLREFRKYHTESTKAIAKQIVSGELEDRRADAREDQKVIAENVVNDALNIHCPAQRAECSGQFTRVHERLDNVVGEIGGLTQAVKDNNSNGDIKRVEEKVDTLIKKLDGVQAAPST